LEIIRIAWRLLWLGALVGAVIGSIPAFVVTYIAQALGWVGPNQSPPGTYVLLGVVGVVWFLAVLLTTIRKIPRY
jgi:hypothetical protein